MIQAQRFSEQLISNAHPGGQKTRWWVDIPSSNDRSAVITRNSKAFNAGILAIAPPSSLWNSCVLLISQISKIYEIAGL